MLTVLALTPFAVLMVIAAVFDLTTYRIPNWISLVLVGGFLVMALAAGMSLPTIGVHLAIALGVLVLTFFCFAMGWMGGGDAKLAAATALWFGVSAGPAYLLIACVFGGALTLGIVFARYSDMAVLIPRIGLFDLVMDKSRGIPYGIALAVAGLVCYPQSPIFLHFIS